MFKLGFSNIDSYTMRPFHFLVWSVFFGIFIFLFSSYVKYEETLANNYEVALGEYFNPVLENITYQGDSYHYPYIYLRFYYSQQTNTNDVNDLKEQQEQIVARWKSRTLDLVCSHPHMRSELEAGIKFDIDLKNADQKPIRQLANLRVEKSRC